MQLKEENLKSKAEWKVWNNIKAELLIKTYIKQKEWNKLWIYETTGRLAANQINSEGGSFPSTSFSLCLYEW